MTDPHPVWPPIAIYDANVLYPAFLRDVLVRLAVAKVVAARWTAEIHDEWTRNLRADRPDLSVETITRIRTLMDRALPDALVTDYASRVEEMASLPDAQDRHVLAAAVHAQAQYLVTRNLRHFPAEVLSGYGVEARAPDEFITVLLDKDPETVTQALERHRTKLQRPPMTRVEYVRALERSHLPTAAQRFAASMLDAGA